MMSLVDEVEKLFARLYSGTDEQEGQMMAENAQYVDIKRAEYMTDEERHRARLHNKINYFRRHYKITLEQCKRLAQENALLEAHNLKLECKLRKLQRRLYIK